MAEARSSLKRHVVAGAILILALVALRWWWGFEADRREAAMIDAAHARGERITLEDFTTGPAAQTIPDSQNAALLLMPAGSGIKLTPAQETWFYDSDPGLPLSENDLTMLRGIVTANATSLMLARQTRPLPRADYRVRLRSPMYTVLLPFVGNASTLRDLQAWAALYHHVRGDDSEAIETLRDLIHHQNVISQSTPVLVVALFSLGIGQVAADATIQIAPDLDVERAVRPATTRPASRDQVRALIDELLDESPMRKALLDAWDGERLMALDAGNEPKYVARVQWMGEVVAPMYKLDAQRAAARLALDRAAATQPTFPAAIAMAPEPSDQLGRSSLHATVTAVSDLFTRTRHAHARFFHVLAARRAAAVALAVRLYALDHGGRLPAQLADLLPDYLPRLPADPFAADEKPFRFLAATTRPLLYSVGEAGIDDPAAAQVAGTSNATSANPGVLVYPLTTPTMRPAR